MLRDTETTGARAAVDAAGLTYPVFVKPANLGSSVGVTKVRTADELDAAVATAADYDEWIVIEQGVDAREIEVGVLGNGDPRASVPGEIVSSHEFYDYDDKYVDGTCELLVPAPLDEAATAAVQDLALRAFRALRCDGLARVDFFYEAVGRRLPGQRGEHHPGLHPGVDVPAAVGGVRRPLPRPRRRARAARDRAPRAAQPVLDQALTPGGRPARAAWRCARRAALASQHHG